MSETSERKKALVIRFNAIGDIVLTTPVTQALADHNYEVHYLVKAIFSEIVFSDKYVTKVWSLQDELTPLLVKLKSERFDVVIDLHNNLRSKRVKAALSKPSYTFKKDRLGLWLLTKLSINRIKGQHVVERFLAVLSPLGIKVAQPSTRYTIPSDTVLPTALPQNFLCIAVGAAWYTKQLPLEKLISIIERVAIENIVLIGGPADVARARQLVDRVGRPVIDLVGKLSIHQSALVIKGAELLLTGDTGMMHIAAALDVPIVAIFGSTHPVLGYTPHYDREAKHSYELIENKTLSCRPCTKQGKKSCPKGHFKCMMDIDEGEVVEAIARKRH